MSKKAGKLRVVLWGKKHYIEVPSLRSGDLHTYLRSRHITSWPPQTHTNDTDSIELGSGLDIKAVQALLNQWS
jgi:hypothetical protein